MLYLLQVPKSYVDLSELVQTEAQKRLDKKEWPVINEDEFYEMIQENGKTDIKSKEEFTLGRIVNCFI